MSTLNPLVTVEQALASGVLRRIPLQDLLDELTRRAAARPYTGTPEATARTLVGMYHDEDQVNAVLLVARIARVAVAFEYRESIEGYLGPQVHLTDEQWSALFGALDDLDETLNEGMARDAVGDWIHRGLARAGIDAEELPQ